MPSVEFGYADVIRLLGRDYVPEELEEIIPMLGVDLEGCTQETISLEVFPNRPDMLSVEGFARALKGFLSVETGFVEYPLTDSGIVFNVESSVKNVRPYVGAAAVKGVTISDEQLKSIMNVQEKLHLTHGRDRVKVAIGVHDATHLKPPFTYKAVKANEISFIPLDMTEEMNLVQILRRHPKGQAYVHVFEGFDRYPIILDSGDQVLSFPPIINGELTRVTEDTTDLFIEVTGWSRLAVDQAVNMVATSIADRGGRIQFVELKPSS